jgi:hypothetical protein
MKGINNKEKSFTSTSDQNPSIQMSTNICSVNLRKLKPTKLNENTDTP